MPDALITNIAGADGESFSTGPVIQDVCNTTTTAIPNGTLIAIQTPITGTTTSIFGVGTAATTASLAPLNIGIAVGGAAPATSIAAAGSVGAAGGTGQAVIHGHCRAFVDSTTTPTVVGHRLIIGTVAGSLADAGTTTAAAGLNYGVVLEALTPVTTGSGSLTNIWFEKT